MRIAQVTPRYHPCIGGLETFVRQVSEELAGRGHGVEVLTVDPSGKLPAVDVIGSVKVRRFRLSGPFSYSADLFRFLQEYGCHYDLVHAHNFHSLIPWLSVRARARAKRSYPLVLMGHYHGRGHTAVTAFLLRLGRGGFRYWYRQADFVLCHTFFEKRLLADHFGIPDSRIGIIPSGVAVEAIRHARPWEVNGDWICVVGRLERYKNIHLAVRAIPHLPGNYRLAVIGAGPYERALMNLAYRLGVADRVFFLGRLDTGQVFQWYRTGKLVLNLSELEAFGLTVIEALAAGRPVLVNNRTALAELAERFEGVTAVDVRGLAPPVLARLIVERARAPFVEPDLEDYRWESVVDRLLGFYEKISSWGGGSGVV